MKVLKAVRRYCRKPQLWIVHSPNSRQAADAPQAAQTEDSTASAQRREAEVPPSGRPTLTSIPAQTIVWAPAQKFDEQWEVYDVKRKAPIAKCGSIFDAQRAARKARA